VDQEDRVFPDSPATLDCPAFQDHLEAAGLPDFKDHLVLLDQEVNKRTPLLNVTLMHSVVYIL